MSFLKDWIRRWLGIPKIEARVDQLEGMMGEIDRLVSKSLDSYGQYSSRSTEELRLMKTDIDNLIDTMENMMKAIEDEAHIKRAKDLLRRLRNNRTRIMNAQAA
jgi:light-regulated signal transduction histidine kinase (bacteriophytochrome)